MQELEKILKEIDNRIHFYDNADEPMMYVETVKKIIRKHMNDGWIPVEEDLPKNESEVWVVLESTYGTGYRIYSSARYLYFENYGESHWCNEHYGYLEWDKYSDGHGGCSQYKVIAWMPIELYRPERREE